MKKELIECGYVSNIKDELIIELKHEGKTFRGTISEVVK